MSCLGKESDCQRIIAAAQLQEGDQKYIHCDGCNICYINVEKYEGYISKLGPHGATLQNWRSLPDSCEVKKDWTV